MENHYNTLGIERNASSLEIKQAYRNLAIKYHPDINGGEEDNLNKFYKISEAYKTLIDSSKRVDYDMKLEKFSQISKTNTEVDEILDFWDEPIKNYFVFFKQPQKIGKIYYAFSDLYIKEKPLTKRQKRLNTLSGFAYAFVVSALIILIGNPKPFWIAAWILIPFFIALSYVLKKNKNIHKNLYVGNNGFAEYHCSNGIDNIVLQREIVFTEITDFYFLYKEIYQDGKYQNTEYKFTFYNSNKTETVYKTKGSFIKQENQKMHPIDFLYCKKVERFWTLYLMNNMQSKMNSRGFIEFCLFVDDVLESGYRPYIRLYKDKIEVIRFDHSKVIYLLDEISELKMVETKLIIRHKNLKKTFFGISGQEDIVPLLEMCNTYFFFHAMEELYGFDLSSK